VQPAGIYDVETVEEQLEGLSFVAYRRVATTITLHGFHPLRPSRGNFVTIDPDDLASALVRDAEALDE